MKQPVAAGKGPSHLAAVMRAAAMGSAKKRKIDANVAVEQIARVLAESDANMDLMTRDLMQLLNDRRVFSGSGRKWTLEGLRQPRCKATALLAEQAARDAEEHGGPFGGGAMRTGDFVAPAQDADARVRSVP